MQLQLEGMDFKDGDRVEDPVLLAEILEIREALEEGLSEEELQKYKQKNDQSLAECYRQISDAFRFAFFICQYSPPNCA